ncbi:hypothetical protein B0H14DRAFT_3152200 [Mycena olivaceomarginata]|nr:hypothetical protein B0H14DRAFT_3152200 [Mycena olivaceomarginata]
MVELAEKIVDTAAMRHPPEGWTAPVLGPRGERQAKPKFELFGEAQAVGMGDWTEEDDNSGEMFAPGTFVELRRNERATHGVVLGEEKYGTRSADDIMFAVPSLVTPDLARRCSTLEIAVEEGQLNARVKVLQHIRQIERAVEDARADILRSGVDIYSIVKSRDPNEWATTTVAEVARLFTPKPTLVTVFATHKYLMERAECFVAGHGYILSQSFKVRPASHISTIKSVFGVVSPAIGPVQDFAKRALPRPAKHTWTPEDIVILTFLHQALQPMRSIQTDPYSIGQSAIIHALDPMQRVDDHETHMTLIDLGVYAPWQDIYSLRHSMNLDLEDPATSPKAKATEALVKRSLATPPRSGPLGPEDFHATDPLDHLRHDFGDTPIYVIDDANAQELDDGVSVEPVAGEPDSFWVHVHIADPASTIPASHVLAQRAAKQSQTAYFLHRTWPLFPKSVMFSGRAGFSLADQTENRVLHVQLESECGGRVGRVCRARQGIARNFVKLSYDEADLLLTGKIMPRLYPFSVAPPPPPKPKLPARQLEDLRTLTMLQNRLHTVSVHPGIIEPNGEAVNLKDFFLGFPEFTYFVTKPNDTMRSSRGLITEAMKLACRTASRWCAERGVDTVRRGASPLTGAPGGAEKLRAMRDDLCYVELAELPNLADGMPVAAYSLEPTAHWTLAVPEGEGYTRATSPLRRYSDLLVHYQIHSALLGQKAPFSRAYLEDYIKWLKHDDQLKKRTETLHQRFWVLLALKRWLEAPNRNIDDPLADLHAITMRTLRSEVRIPGLGIAASLEDVDQKHTANWELARSLPVKIDDIKLGTYSQLATDIPQQEWCESEVHRPATANMKEVPTGPEAYHRPKELRDVGDHPIKNVWEDKLVPSVFAVLKELQVDWTSLDVVRIPNLDEPNGPVVLWIGVTPSSLSRDDGTLVSARVCLALFAEHQLADVEVHVRESLLVRQNGPKLMKLVFWSNAATAAQEPLTTTLGIPICTGGFFIGEGGSTKSTGVCGKEDDADISYVTPGTWLLKDIAEHGIEEPNVIAGPELNSWNEVAKDLAKAERATASCVFVPKVIPNFERGYRY